MKKFLKFTLIVLSFAILTGCGTNEIEKSWTMEFVSDYDGNILITSPQQPDLADKQCDLQLSFEKDGSFVLSDKTNKQEWIGTFKSEKLESSISLELSFENEVVRGVYGTREYQDEKSVHSITLQTDDRIISFLEN